MEDEPAAEEEAEAPAPEVTGYVEAGYHLNLSKPHSDITVPLRPYSGRDGNTFILHNGHIAVNHAFSDEVSAVVEIDAGGDAAITSGQSGYDTPPGDAPPYAFDLQEAYATYSKSGFTLVAGKFVTYEGIEVIEGPSDPTLTRGYLYGYAEAFTHVGVKMSYAFSDKVDFGIGVVNGWDLWLDNNDWKTIIFRLGLTPSDSFWAGLSGSVGSEQDDDKNPRISLDFTGAYTASDSFVLNFQANFGTEKDAGTNAMGEVATATWFGIGLQPVYTSGAFSFGSRVEWMMDKNGGRIGYGPKGQYLNITLTPGVTVADHFTMRLEGRADLVLAANDGPGGKDVLNGKSTEFTLGLGAHYVF